MGPNINIRSPGIWSGVEKRAGTGGSPTTISVPAKDAAAFRSSLQADPKGTLGAVGVTISPDEARRVSEQLRELSKKPGTQDLNMKIGGEVTAGVKLTFGK